MENKPVFGFGIDNMKGFEGLKDICDDSTTVMYIPTPKGWKCKRKGCTSDVKHTHTTYDCLKPNAPRPNKHER